MVGRTFLDVEETPGLRAPPAGLLVVEDDLDHRETLREILEEEGYRVETAIHGRDALERLSAGPPPDLILLDLMMPEMDGWTFMGELSAREALASIPIVVTSQVGNRVPQSASTRFISKPLDRTRLLQTISACLWRRGRGEGAGRFTRVLVLADSMIGTTIARLLAWDHDVVAVTSARAALGRIDTGERFDVILCDAQMPDMSGVDLHAKLANQAPEQAARMVFMTGATPAPEVDGFVKRASSRWIKTPFTMTELRALIQLLVAGTPDRRPQGSSA